MQDTLANPPSRNPAIDLSETHPTDAPSWVNYSGTHDPQAAELARERANARAEAARREAEIAAKQTALDNERAAWLAVLARGNEARAKVLHARQQTEILESRRALVEAEFDQIVGAFVYSADWCAVSGIDPLVPTAVIWSRFGQNYPLEFLGARLAALIEAIARARKNLVVFETDETAALAEARCYAKEHNLEHDFPDEFAEPTLPPECEPMVHNERQAKGKRR